MIDTIRLHIPIALTKKPLPSGWGLRDISTFCNEPSDGPPVRCAGLLHEHLATGLRACGTPSLLNTVEVSLPRVLHGHNGKLIQNQHDLDRALAKVYSLLRQIGRPRQERFKPYRVSLAWHFAGNLNQFMGAFEQAKHKSIRTVARGYDNESMFWQGHDIRIRVYDKIRQMTGRAGDVLRVEVQLRGRWLKKYLAHDVGQVEVLRFADCYRAYREILLGLTTPKPPAISSLANMFALAALDGFKAKDSAPFELWAVGKSKEHVRRMNRQMAAVWRNHFNFSALLPVGEPPPSIEVDCTGRRLNTAGMRDTGASSTTRQRKRQ